MSETKDPEIKDPSKRKQKLFHDLNNVFSIARVYSNNIAEDESLSEDVREMSREVSEAVEKAIAMVKELQKIDFPQKQENEESGQGEEEAIAGKHEIVYIDDEEALLRLVDRSRPDNFKIGIFASVEKGIEQALALPRGEVLVVDFDLNQDINGIEVSERIKKLRPDLKILLVSGGGFDGTPQQYIEKGIIDGFLAKPFHGGDFYRKVFQLMKKE